MPSAILLQRQPLKPFPVAAAAVDTLPVPGAALWLTTRDLTTLYQSAGGAAAALDSDPVGQWQDKSGNARHVAEVTNKPALKLAQVNGFPSVRFDGTNDKLQALFTLNAPFVYFVVMKQLAWTNQRVFIGGGADDNFSFGQGPSATPQIAIIWQGNGGGGTADANLALNTWGIVEVHAKTGVNQSFVKVNNNTATTESVTDSGTKGGVTIGAHPNPSGFSSVEFAEVLLYPSDLSAGNSTLVRDYLNGKYSIF